MARTRKKVFVVFAVIAFVLALALVTLRIVAFRSALPNPNGYDDFVKAGQMVTATLDRRRSLADYSVRYKLRAEFKSLFSLGSWQTRQHFKSRYYQAERRRRQTMLDFAVRAYELETGEKPKSFTNLVPAYLKTIPRDPLTGTNLVL